MRGLTAATSLLVVACGDNGLAPDGGLHDAHVPSDAPRADDASAPDAHVPAALMITAPSVARVPQGSWVEIEITLTRDATVVGPISLSITGLTPQIQSDDVVVAEGATRATLVLRAPPLAPPALGSRAMIEARVVGETEPAAQHALDVWIVGAPGTLDESFGEGGATRVIAVPGRSQITHDIEVLADRSLVASGTWVAAGGGGWLLRLTARGARDPGFGDDGLFVEAGGELSYHGLAVESDGSVVVAARIGAGADTAYVLRRHRPDGALDESFGEDGELPTLVSDAVSRIEPSSAGWTLVSGRGVERRTETWALADFGEDGAVLLPGSTYAIEADGSFTAGASGPFGNSIHRYQSDGTEDLARRASDVFPAGTTGPSIASLALARDGSIVVGYRLDSTPGSPLRLARWGVDDALDPTFGEDGSVLVGDVQVAGLEVLDDGSIVLLASYGPGSPIPPFVARFDVGGAPIESFGVAGRVELLSILPWQADVEHDLHRVTIAGSSTDGDRSIVLHRMWL